MKYFSVFLILLSTTCAWGQAPDAPAPSETEVVDTITLSKPKSRQRPKPNQPPNESSSFIGDPDNLDPLEARRDNIKEDDEPVLDDIKDVLNSDLGPAQPENPGASPSDAGGGANPPAPEVVDVGAGTGSGASGAGSTSADEALSADNPDLDLEKQFHRIYQRYNKNPTSNEAWAAASSKQTSRLYEVQKGDTLWSISQVLFGDPQFWPKLWAINKQGILNPHFINPKMKIYFYEGDEENSPTLTLGQKASEETDSTATEGEARLTDAGGEANQGGGDAPTVEPGQEKVSKIEKVDEALRVPRRKLPPVAKIPHTLPEGRNKRFFGLYPPVNIKFDLAAPPASEIVFRNNVIITDEKVQGDILLSISVDTPTSCDKNRVLKDIKIKGDLSGEYDIYESLDPFDTETGRKYAYRLIGRAEAFKNKYIQIKDCIGVMSSDAVIMPTGRIKDFATQKVSNIPNGLLIGGPDYGNKVLYSLLHYAFIDFGQQDYEVGKTYSTVSNITERINSDFIVVSKFGSYAVVVFTTIYDQLEVGDRIATAEDSGLGVSSSSSSVPQDTLEDELSLE